MSNIELKRLFFFISGLLLVLLLIGVLLIIIPYNNDYDHEILFWTKVGAISGWIGALFGAIALIISTIALIVPSIVKYEANLMFGYIGGIDEEIYETLIVTVKNTGMKSITIKNICLRFEDFAGTIIVSTMGNGTPVQLLQPNFPEHLDVGEDFNFYIPLSKMIVFLKDQHQIKPEAKVLIVVNEVTEGIRLFKTKITKADIIKPVD